MKQIKTPTLNDIARQLEALQNSIDELQQENKALKRGQDRVELAISQPDAVQNLKDEVAAPWFAEDSVTVKQHQEQF